MTRLMNRTQEEQFKIVNEHVSSVGRLDESQRDYATEFLLKELIRKDWSLVNIYTEHQAVYLEVTKDDDFKIIKLT